MTTHETPSDRRGDAVLWASACVIAALVLVQAGRPAGAPAMDPAAAAATAAMGGSGSDDFSILASRSGRGDDADPNEVVWVLDSHAEAIMVYEIEDARRGGVLFREGSSLRGLFQAAGR